MEENELGVEVKDSYVAANLAHAVESLFDEPIFFGSNGDSGAYTDKGRVLHQVIETAIAYGRGVFDANA